MEFTLTNTAPGVRGIHTAKGMVYFKPKQSRSVEFEDSEAGEAMAKRAKKLGFTGFEASIVVESETQEPVAVDREDLKKQADELGLDYAKNIPTEKLKELIDAKLAE